MLDGIRLGDIITELRSLGIDPKRMSDLNDTNELLGLAEILKQSLIEEFKLAYSNQGHKFQEEAKATTTKF